MPEIIYIIVNKSEDDLSMAEVVEAKSNVFCSCTVVFWYITCYVLFTGTGTLVYGKLHVFRRKREDLPVSFILKLQREIILNLTLDTCNNRS